jgi:hypothetical protein
MMRRLFALVLTLGGLLAVATPAAAQTIAPLPSGVVLRVHGGGASATGVLYSQSADSVWLRQDNKAESLRGFSVSQITKVEQAKPEYAKSLIVGTAAGLLLGAVLNPIVSPGDRDIAMGFSVIAGAVAGLVFKHTHWVQVPLR